MYTHCVRGGDAKGLYWMGGFPGMEKQMSKEPFMSEPVMTKKLRILNPFGSPQQFNTIDGCPLFATTDHISVDPKVLLASPPNSYLTGGSRKMVDNTCVDQLYLVPQGQYSRGADMKSMWRNEHWTVQYGIP